MAERVPINTTLSEEDKQYCLENRLRYCDLIATAVQLHRNGENMRNELEGLREKVKNISQKLLEVNGARFEAERERDEILTRLNSIEVTRT